MSKNCLLVLALAAVVVGGAFAQGYEGPANTVTIDFGPTIIGMAISSMGDAMGADEGVSTTGFGIAAQYERQLLDKLTVGGRFAYLGAGMGMTDTDKSGARTTVDLDLSSFSLEGHARFYPSAGAFFVDGMLGYANLALTASGKMVVDGVADKADFTISRSFLKLGAKIGWRIDFGKPGGFIFEPSFGYSTGLGLGDELGTQLAGQFDGDIDDETSFNDLFSVLEDYIFIGGPRMCLSFGWRF